MDFRHKSSKEVRSPAANSAEAKKLAKDPEWDRLADQAEDKPAT